MLSRKTKRALAERRVAVRCLTKLAVGMVHFNYRSDLLRAMMGLLQDVDAENVIYAVKSMEKLFTEGRDFSATNEVVQLLADLVRRFLALPQPFKKNGKWITPKGVKWISPDAVATLCHIRYTQVGRVEDGEDGGDMDEDGLTSTTKRGKKKEKKRKKMDDVDRAFAQALATENREDVRRIQSRTFEAMFESLFRVIKIAAGPKEHRTAREAVLQAWRGTKDNDFDFDQDRDDGVGMMRSNVNLTVEQRRAVSLLPPTLRALSQFTHLIGIEYMQDLTDVLGLLSASPVMTSALRTHLLLAVCEILNRQMDTLRVDRHQFYVDLYSVLRTAGTERLLESHPVLDEMPILGHPDEDIGGKKDGDGDGDGNHSVTRVAKQLEIEEAERILTTSIDDQKRLVDVAHVMLMQNRVNDQTRLASFCHRLSAVSFWGRPTLSVGLLSLVKGLMKRYARLRHLLENEGDGSALTGIGAGRTLRGFGGFDPYHAYPTDAAGIRAPLWELAILARHFHPTVSALATAIASLDVATGAFPNRLQHHPALHPSLTAPDLAKIHAAEASGGFRPGPTAPVKVKLGQGNLRRRGRVDLSDAFVAQMGREVAGLMDKKSKKTTRSMGKKEKQRTVKNERMESELSQGEERVPTTSAELLAVEEGIKQGGVRKGFGRWYETMATIEEQGRMIQEVNRLRYLTLKMREHTRATRSVGGGRVNHSMVQKKKRRV